MKIEVIRSYTSEYIPHAGKAFVFITGSHQQNYMYLERIVIFEPFDGLDLVKSSQCIGVNVSEWTDCRDTMFDKEPTLLEDFIVQEAINIVRGDIFRIADDFTNRLPKIVLEQIEPFHNIMTLKSKHPDSLEWLRKNTLNKALKANIDLLNLISVK